MQSGGAAIGGSLISLSPSFNAYSSSDSLAQIAARVVSEFRQELDEAGLEEIDDVYDNNDGGGQFSPPRLEGVRRNDDVKEEVEDEEEEEEEEFEFAFVSRDAPTSPIAAEEVFYNGQIRPVYPVFDQTLLLRNDDDIDAVNKDSDKSSAAAETAEEVVTKPRRTPLRMLMIEEERETASCSSSEADDLENLPPGTYCVWAPPKATSGKGGGGCGKSGSTGSSKRWKFRDLLSRSSSDGSKDNLVFLAPKAEEEKEGGNVVVVRKVRKADKGAADGEKRRTFLPYKQDLVGFFSNVNGLSRNLHPF